MSLAKLKQSGNIRVIVTSTPISVSGTSLSRVLIHGSPAGTDGRDAIKEKVFINYGK